MRATFYETNPLDAVVFAGAIAVLVAALIAASYVPGALQVNRSRYCTAM